MIQWEPCKRRIFIQRLRRFGFVGPFSGTRHQFMIYGQNRLAIPANNEYSILPLRMMLSEIEEILGRKIGLEEWDHF